MKLLRNIFLVIKYIFQKIVGIEYRIALEQHLKTDADINQPGKWNLTPLIQAAHIGKLNVVKFLLEKGADLNFNSGSDQSAADDLLDEFELMLGDEETDPKEYNPYPQGATALMAACAQGQLKIVKLLLAFDPNIELKNNEGWTALYFAAYGGNYKIFKALINQGANWQERDIRGSTPFMLACYGGGKKIVKKLLDLGAQCEDRDNDGWTSIFYAVVCGNFNILKILCRENVEVNFQLPELVSNLNQESNSTPQEGSIGQVLSQNEVDYLLAAVSEADDVSNLYDVKTLKYWSKWTPLMFACKYNRPKIAELLLQNGADGKIEDGGNKNAFLISIVNNSIDVVKNFIGKGIPLEIDNKNFWESFNELSKEGSPVLLRLLLETYSGIACSKEELGFSLICAIQSGHLHSVELLLEYNPSLEEVDSDGKGPFLWAASMGSTEVGKILMDKNINRHLIDKSGKSPLFHAILCEKFEFAELIKTEAGIWDNLNDIEGNLLIKAVKNRRIDYVEYLIKAGNSVNKYNFQGITPVLMGAFTGELNMVKLLVSKGADLNLISLGKSDLNRGEVSADVLLNDFESMLGGEEEGPPEIDLDPGISILMYAVCSKNMSLIEYLIEKGVDLNAKDSRGETPLTWAASRDDEKIVEMLESRGGKWNKIIDQNGDLLFGAFQKNNLYYLSKLLNSAKINPNVLNREGMSPFLIAASEGNLEMLKILAESGADILQKTIDLKPNVQEVQVIQEDQKIETGRVAEGEPSDVELLSEFKSMIGDNEKKQDQGTISELSAVELLSEFDSMLGDNEKKQDQETISERSAEEQLNEFQKMLGGHVNTPKTNFKIGRDALGYALNNGHSNCVTYLLSLGLDPNEENSDGMNSLMMALKLGKMDVAEAVVKKINNIDQRNINGNSALVFSIEGGHSDFVSFLIGFGANLNLGNNQNETPLMLAVKFGHLDIAEFLLWEKVQTDIRDNDGWDAFLWAVARGDLDFINLFLDNGVVPEDSNNNEHSVLGTASRYEHLEVLELLLAKGMSLEDSSENIITPLMEAVIKENSQIVAFLLAVGVDPNKAIDGEVAIELAALKGNLEIMHMLFENGVNIDFDKLPGPGPLIYAAIWGKLDVVKFLEDLGVAILSKEGQALSPFMFACGGEHLEIMEYLLSKGEIINVKDDEKMNGLIYAIKGAKFEAVKFLIDHGAEIETRDKNGKTTFMYAAEFLDPDIINYLYEHGVDIHACDNNGALAIDYVDDEFRDVFEGIVKNFERKIS